MMGNRYPVAHLETLDAFAESNDLSGNFVS
jgi:hypothetical protein